MSKSQSEGFANRNSSHIGGAGPGGDATNPLSRARDLAAFAETQSARPLKSPRRLTPLVDAKPKGHRR